MAKNIVFLGISDLVPTTQYLPQLTNEIDYVRQAFGIAIGKQQVELQVNGSLSLSRLFTELQLLMENQRLSIFHYAGHATTTTLILEGAKVFSDAVGEMIGKCSPHLVVLNGCYTLAQSDYLLLTGAKAVIGTVSSVGDKAAALFAKMLYNGIGSGMNIKDSFFSAEQYAKATVGDFSPQDKWVLSTREQGNILWSLGTTDSRSLVMSSFQDRLLSLEKQINEGADGMKPLNMISNDILEIQKDLKDCETVSQFLCTVKTTMRYILVVGIGVILTVIVEILFNLR